MASSHRIVVGGEESAAGIAALRWAVTEAERTEAHVVVLSTFEEQSEPQASFESDPELDRRRRDARYRTQAWVVEVLSDVASKVPVLVSTTEGRMELALAGAGSRADLVVFGHDPSGEHLLQTEVLSRFCPCPVVRVDPRQVAEVV